MNQRHLQQPNPYWHWKAAGNFMGGGAGAGLVFFASLWAPAAAVPLLTLAGLALVALGLFCVWLEIGRPLRAMNVLLHLRSSWMSREALAANVLFVCGLASLAGFQWATLPAALAALLFLYCQARLLGAARGIPTWRHPLTRWLVGVTGLAEGLGLFWLFGAWSQPDPLLSAPLALLVLARWLLWHWWLRSLARQAAAPALHALGRQAPTLVWIGTVVPLACIVIAVLVGSGSALAMVLLALAGLAAAGAGAHFKYVLVTRTAHHHGFALPHLPVRGVRRTAPL